MRDALQEAGIGTGGLRLSYLVMHAELEAVICSGPLRGKRFTHALFDERVSPAALRERKDSPAELAQRYLRARGPATARGSAWWSGVTVADCRAGAEAAGEALFREQPDGKTYWMAPAASPPPAPSGRIHLLPNDDEHVVASRDHGPSLDPALVGRLDPEGDALMMHVIVRDGLVVGGWRRTLTARAARIETDLLLPLDAAGRRRSGPLRRRSGGISGCR